MRLRSVSFFIKEAFINSYRNKYMTIASIIIIASTLFLFGLFFIFVLNVQLNIEKESDQPEIQIFMNYNLNEEQALVIQQKVKESKFIKDIKLVTKKEGFQKLIEGFGEENERLLDGFDEDFLPYSLLINLNTPNMHIEFKEFVEGIPGIDSVEYSAESIENLMSVINVVKYLALYLTAILVIISVIIIVNTVKLAVVSRKMEINIMKYIGATNWFIKWPFVIEGIIIGAIGAVFSYALIEMFYKNILTEKLLKLENIIELVTISQVRNEIFVIFIIFGITMGAIGSSISVRKYLKV